METSNWFQFRWLAIGLMAFFWSVAFQIPAHGQVYEGFEDGIMPPGNWTLSPTNAGYTWQISSNAFIGSYAARVSWDYSQDEWLVSPYVTNPNVMGFYSQGDPFWCRDDNDNCDLEVWLIKGTGINDGDDTLLGQADGAWSVARTYGYSAFLLTSDPGSRLRIGFRYVGDNGADVFLDEIAVNESKELRFDLGASGIWRYYYDGADNWQKLSPSNAEWMGQYADKLVADFGTLGLYVYVGTTWFKISTGNADNSGNTMMAYNNGLVVDFGASGLWYYSAGGSWQKLSPVNVQWLGVYSNKLVADFGALGMYEYDGSTWAKISTGDADNSGNTMVAFAGGLAVDFGTSGLYYYDGSSWTSLSTANVQWLDNASNIKLFADFGASGFYQYDGSTWTKLSTGDADNSGNTMAVVSTGVVVDFGSSGVYYYNGTSWSQFSPSNAQWLKINSGAGGNYLYADFGTLGVYRGPAWTKITTADPDNSGNTMINW